ncbi:MAG: DUF5343 domain-containing protein [Solirubrobacteraceae bacterium]
MEAAEKITAPPYFAFKTLTNMLAQMEEHGPPNRVDRSFLSGMSGAGQTQFIHGLKSLGLIAEDGTVQPRLTALVTEPDSRPSLMGQLVRERYPEAVELGQGNATTGELVELFKDSHGVQGDTARKAISFYLAAAKYAGDIRLSPNFKTPTNRSGTSNRRRNRPAAVQSPGGAENGADEGRSDIPIGLHPALAGLLGDIPKRGSTWTQSEYDDFMAAFVAVIKIAAPIEDASDHDSEEEDF